MNKIWLGVAAVIIALGVATLMGLSIFLGGDLVMHRENWELARIFVPSIVSVIGWLVTIWWALKQVDIASKRNRELQYEMLQSNEKIKAIDSVILAYIKINKSLNQIRRHADNFKHNIEFKNAGKSTPDLTSFFHNSGNSFSEMLENLETLKFRTVRLAQYGITMNKNLDFLDDIHSSFSGKSDWLNYQEQAALYFNNENHYDDLFLSIDTVSENCNKLCEDALNNVASINTRNKNKSPDTS